MKTSMKVLLVVLFVCVFAQEVVQADDAFTQTPVMNLSTNIYQPSGWLYESQPGTYFWTGFRWGFGVFAFAFVLSMLRSTTGDHEEL